MMPFFAVLLLAVVLFFVLVRRAGGWGACGRRDDVRRPESAAEILDRRYARGEISREEYQEMKKEIG